MLIASSRVVLLPATSEVDLDIALSRVVLLISELVRTSSSWNHQRIAHRWPRKFLVVQAAQGGQLSLW